VNKRKPIKKNKLSNPWLLRAIISITVLAIIFGLNSLANKVEIAEIFGLLILIGLSLIFLFVLFFSVEKITGFSYLRGVEWVGRVTLELIDWLITKIQIWRGNDIKKTNYRDPQGVDSLSPKKQHQPRITLPSTETEAVIAKNHSPHAEYDLHSDIPLVVTNNGRENLADQSLTDTNPEPTTDKQPLIEDEVKQHQHKEPHATIPNTKSEAVIVKIFSTHAEHDLHSVIPSVVTNNGRDNLVSQSLTGNNSDLTSNEQPLIEDKVKHTVSPNYKVDTFEDIDSSELELSVDTELQTELEMDPVEEELKHLFSAQQNGVADVSVTEIVDETAFLTDEIDSELSTVRPVEEQDENHVQSDFNAQNLFSSEQSNETDALALPDEDSPVTHSNTLSNLKGTNLQSSTLLEQAEKTTATIISSLFVDKFPKQVIEPLSTEYHLPTLDLLQAHQQSIRAYSSDDLEEMSRSVERVLNDYKISVEVMGAYPGPIITCFELALAPGIKVSRISGLAKDLARALLVTSVRVVEIIEGTPYVGLEIPNKERELVSFREILSSEQFQTAKSPLTLALGKDVSGKTVVSDLGKMPHLLVAGTTGSGKSVAINTMILSLLYKATSEQVRLIMIDPKMLELSVYEGIPHLLTPVVTDMKEAQNALRWAVAEMERRYKLMSKVGVRNLAGFNQKINDAAKLGESIRDPLFQLTAPLAEGESFPVLSTLPHIVIVIDELADMMMIVGKKVEELIARLAQKARAAGIHLILATQRPSVDVLTGLIKANVPTRMSFQVSSKIDSRTILDQGGAEALLGNGDMLFLPSGTSIPIRAHGAFVDDPEVHAVVDYLKAQGITNYLPEILQEEPVENVTKSEIQVDETDVLYGEAVDFVMETGKASISSVQRRFKVGYNRAARMIEQMEEEAIVSEPEGNGSRRVLNQE